MNDEIGLIIEQQEFFKGLKDAHLQAVSQCASVVEFAPDEFIFREGGDANSFYMVRRGRVAIEIYIPEKGPVVIETIEAGEILGWSWLVPPYRWAFDARAVDAVRTICFDGRCLRARFEMDHDLGYEMHKRFAGVVAQRLQSARLQILDLYGTKK